MGGFRKGGFSISRLVLKPDVAIASEVFILSKNSLAIIRNEKPAQRGSFRPDVPADIGPKTSVRPSKSWKNKHLARTCRADVHEKTSV